MMFSSFAVWAVTAASLVAAAPVVPEEAIYLSLIRRDGGPPSDVDSLDLTPMQMKAHMACGIVTHFGMTGCMLCSSKV